MSKVFPDIFSSDMFEILTNITCTKTLTALKSQRKTLETIKSVIIFYIRKPMISTLKTVTETHNGETLRF